MDKLSSSLTAACKLEEWPAVARVHMLELLEMRSMAWAPSESVTQYYRQKEFSQTVQIRDETITITGKSLDLDKTAKIVLNEFFNVIPTEERRDERSSSRPPTIEAVESEDEEPGIELVQPSISYNKQELMAMARSPFCRETPTSWTEIAKETPGVVRGQKRSGPTSKLAELINRNHELACKIEEAHMSTGNSRCTFYMFI